MLKKILMILILMLIFGVNNIYADTINREFLSNLSSSNRQYNFSGISGNLYDYSINFDTANMQVKGYSYIQGNVYIINKTSSAIYTNTQNIDWNLTCSNFSYNTNNTSDGYIYYINDSNPTHFTYDEIFYICDSWENTGTISETISQFNLDNEPSIQLTVRTNSNVELPCELNGTVFKCPVAQFEEFNRLRIIVLPKGYGGTYWVNFSNVVYKFKTDNQTIINNQNTINNSINDLNDNITDSNVSGNNSSNTISDIGGTFNTENDFLLGLLTIPYTFWTSITNVFSNSCSALNVGTMFDKPLIFPCIELNDYLGNIFTTIIDVIFSGIIMSAFVRRIIRYYQALLSLDNNAAYIGGVKVW